MSHRETERAVMRYLERVREHSDELRRAELWEDVTEIVYTPEPVRELANAIVYLHHAAYPHMGSPSVPKIGRGDARGWSSQPTPDAARKGLRRQLRRLEKKIATLADEVWDIAEGAPRTTRRGWWCPGCRRGQRFGASFCDNCGLPRPQEQDLAPTG